MNSFAAAAEGAEWAQEVTAVVIVGGDMVKSKSSEGGRGWVPFFLGCPSKILCCDMGGKQPSDSTWCVHKTTVGPWNEGGW